MGCSTSVLECLVGLSSGAVVADAEQNVVVLSLRLERLWNVQTTESLGGLAGIIFGKVWAFKRCELGTVLLGGMTCSTDPSKGASMNRREAGLVMEYGLQVLLFISFIHSQVRVQVEAITRFNMVK
jgi:hypothetical protein